MRYPGQGVSRAVSGGEGNGPSRSCVPGHRCDEPLQLPRKIVERRRLRADLFLNVRTRVVGVACATTLATQAVVANRANARAEAAHPAYETNLKIVKVKGDGRCMFRALALGLAHNKKKFLSEQDEVKEADLLRLAVSDCICRSATRRHDFEEALIAIKMEGSIQSYCQRLIRPSFWGGEAELLVLSRLLKTPISVYIREGAGFRGSFRSIQQYGEAFGPALCSLLLETCFVGRWHATALLQIAAEANLWICLFALGMEHAKKKKPVRLLYNGNNHYDLLLP
mmetsp:Transcript_12601/g.46025  ORF Transcript_12601/g.46025 Transcript_12601/m.46025 type:complete len:282 (+) Transcript_12601:122-967(+)